MVTNLYQIYDMTGETIAGPIVAYPRAAAATRMFHEVLQDKTTLPGKYPEQFTLICIGTQDSETGELTPCGPDIVSTGEEWAKTQRLLADRERDALPLGQ